MQPNGAKKNRLAQAIFSKEGPNLTNPEVTKRPKVAEKKVKCICSSELAVRKLRRL